MTSSMASIFPLEACLLWCRNFMFHGDLGSVRQDTKKREKKEVREIKSPKKKNRIMYNRVPRPHQKNIKEGNGDSWDTEVLIAVPKRKSKKIKKKISQPAVYLESSHFSSLRWLYFLLVSSQCCFAQADEHLSGSAWPFMPFWLSLSMLGVMLLLTCKFMICNFMFHGDLGSVRQDMDKKRKKRPERYSHQKK